MNSHTKIAKFIHWIFTLLYAYGIFKQVDDLTELEDPSLLNFEILFATIFLILVLIRYFYMKDTPALLGANNDVPRGHLLIAKTVHRLVYFSLIIYNYWTSNCWSFQFRNGRNRDSYCYS